MPNISQAPLTTGRTGSDSSSSTTPSSVAWASSLQTVPTPPRVGSRSHRVAGAAASSASTMPLTDAVSEEMSASMARSPRASMTAIPWSPMVPEMISRSPGRTAGNDRPAGITPTPAVVTNRPSAAPLGTTFVSPVTICTPAATAAAAMSATISFSSAMGKPSSSTNAAEIHCGTAPDMARSFTVPCTARWPIDPPGKRSGCTTNESVENASRSPDGRVSTAPSPRSSSCSLRNASTNTASTSAAEDLPPAPWARVTISSRSRGRRLRNASIRSMTSPSAKLGPELR